MKPHTPNLDPRVVGPSNADLPAPLSSIDRPPEAPPRTLTVLGLLALTAATFSYLGSYAIYNALVGAGVLSSWSGQDPRPRWFGIGFCLLMLTFMTLGEVFRRISRHDLAAIDAMTDAEDN